MKKIIMVMIVALICGFTSEAQRRKLTPEQEQQIFNAKAKEMQQRLDLSESQAEAFVPIYQNYISEIRALKVPPRFKKEGKEEITTDEVYARIVADLDFKKSILEIQKKYIGELKSVLNVKQLRNFLRVEESIQRNVHDARKGKMDSIRSGKSKKTPKTRMGINTKQGDKVN